MDIVSKPEPEFTPAIWEAMNSRKYKKLEMARQAVSLLPRGCWRTELSSETRLQVRLMKLWCQTMTLWSQCSYCDLSCLIDSQKSRARLVGLLPAYWEVIPAS